MKIAIVGCAHGEIEEIITTIQSYEETRNCSIDLLIVCGDFQAIRNENDLCTMACPAKYRRLNSFYKYYSGESVAPFPIIVIGGNHEASNYLFELHYGGYLAPNIYYLGCSGSVIFGGLRISGLSGIFKYHDFNKGHHETLPMNESDLRSIYHVRRYEIWKLSQLHGNNIDILLSHDWPTCIWKYGNWKTLIKYKKHFEPDLIKNQLGNPSLNHLLFQLQPKQWFAGHLHCKFSAIVDHKDTNNVTRFLALDKFDKTNNRRKFIQVLDFPHPENAERDKNTGFYKLEYDPIWLSILKSTNKFMSINKNPMLLPRKDNDNDERWDYRPTKEEIDDIVNRFNGDLTISTNNSFVKQVEITKNPNNPKIAFIGKSPEYVLNEQTQCLMDKLGISCKIAEKHKNLNDFNLNDNRNNISYAFNSKIDDNDANDNELFQWDDNNDTTSLKRNQQQTVEDPNEINIDMLVDEPPTKRMKQ